MNNLLVLIFSNSVFYFFFLVQGINKLHNIITKQVEQTGKEESCKPEVSITKKAILFYFFDWFLFLN